jgi:Fic family protein
MDVTRFTPNRTGELVPVTTDDGTDYAFIPAPLPPPKWEFPSTLWPLLAEAREQLARLDEKGKTIQNPTLLLEPLQKREAIRSSSIEGTYTTAKELLLFELAPRTPTSRDDKANDWLEVANYDHALRFGVKNLKAKDGLPLSKRLICDMHRILMSGVRGSDGAPGEVRTKHVYVGSGHRYVPPPPGDVLAGCLNDLDAFIGNALRRRSYHPLVLAYLVHYQFEAIHPFRDGNGRVGRLLLALTTYDWCQLHLPWLYMSAYFERFKDEYVDNMFRISTHGDWDRWIEFCLRGTAEQSKDALRRCDALDSYRREIHAKIDNFPRLANLVDWMFVKPIFTAGDVAKWGDSSLPTARRDIELLEKNGFVDHLQGDRPKYYFVPRIYSIAYHEGGAETIPRDVTADAGHRVTDGEA